MSAKYPIFKKGSLPFVWEKSGSVCTYFQEFAETYCWGTFTTEVVMDTRIFITEQYHITTKMSDNWDTVLWLSTAPIDKYSSMSFINYQDGLLIH
jgi:hypothetical protein